MRDHSTSDSLVNALFAAQNARARGLGGVIVGVVMNDVSSTPALGTRMFVSETGDATGSIFGPWDSRIIADSLGALTTGEPRSVAYDVDGEDLQAVRGRRGEVELYFDVLTRTSHLVIVGAGHIAVPLAQMGALLSFDVIVLDDRPEYANRERFPSAAQVLVGPYRETLADVHIDSSTYVVLVTRGHVHDLACLEVVIDSPAAYIGMIGSKRRVRTVLEHAVANGYERARLERIFAPVGLNIGARTPAEIAVAISAEIVRVKRGGDGTSLSRGELRRE